MEIVIERNARQRLESLRGVEYCENCHFWNRESSEEQSGVKVARCRRFPPVAVLITSMVRPPLASMAPQMKQGPGTVPTIVPMNDWCGEWRPHITPLT